MKVINEQEFNALTNKEGYVLVDFFATWCGPCKMLAPVLEELANEQETITIVKVDVDQESGLAMKYGVMSVPTMILFKEGKALGTLQGFKPKQQLEAELKKFM